MTQPGKDGVAQWGGAALPDLIEAMAGRSRQLWLRLVIGVLIACIVGPSLGARRSACAAVSKGGERIQRRISRPGQSRNPHTAERRARHGSDYVFR